MKKKILIIIGIILVVLIICGIVFFINRNKVSQVNDVAKAPTTANAEDSSQVANADIVIIKNGNIENENLIDDFISTSNNGQASTLQIETTTDGTTKNVKLEFVLGENANNSTENNVNQPVPDSQASYEDYQKYYGYYKLITDKSEEKFDKLHYFLRRKTTDGEVSLILYSANKTAELEFPVICKYNLDSSAYTKKFDNLMYSQRKDLGINQIAAKNQFDNADFEVYTFGGDVSITVEGNMTYSLEDALNQKIITVQDIIDQAKMDEKYGICETGYYSDGGSTEYLYKDYTILKYNTLDGNKDLVIGMPGQIINQVNKIKQ